MIEEEEVKESLFSWKVHLTLLEPSSGLEGEKVLLVSVDPLELVVVVVAISPSTPSEKEIGNSDLK